MDLEGVWRIETALLARVTDPQAGPADLAWGARLKKVLPEKDYADVAAQCEAWRRDQNAPGWGVFPEWARKLIWHAYPENCRRLHPLVVKAIRDRAGADIRRDCGDCGCPIATIPGEEHSQPFLRCPDCGGTTLGKFAYYERHEKPLKRNPK